MKMDRLIYKIMNLQRYLHIKRNEGEESSVAM